MMVTPVSLSPAQMERWIGAAPRQRGRIEPCTLIQPSLGVSKTTLGSSKP
ncbi:Uncharacterised protein [Vibrio cholerae]|nr:Uncharacterised protein [Vibrio cholerae]